MMKVEYKETDYGFWINFEPETMEDQTFLLRMQMNGVKSSLKQSTSVYKSGVSGWISANKKKQTTSDIK